MVEYKVNYLLSLPSVTYDVKFSRGIRFYLKSFYLDLDLRPLVNPPITTGSTFIVPDFTVTLVTFSFSSLFLLSVPSQRPGAVSRTYHRLETQPTLRV